MTILTTQPEEPVGQNPAAEETFEFLGDVLGEPLSFQFRQSFEGSEVPHNGLIKDRFFRPARPVRR